MTVEELKVVMTAEVNKFQASMSQATTSLNSVKTAVSATTKATTALKAVMSSLGLGIGIAGVVQLGKEIVKTASDAMEVENVVDTVFQGMDESIDKFATDAELAFNMSQNAAKEYLGILGAMGTSMGLTTSQALTLSKNLTGLTADVGSFYNVSEDEAFTALKGIFTGETESLKRFGVVMTEANLKLYAQSNGYKTLYEDMNQAQKVALRYEYVVNSLSNAVGDAHKTANGYANGVKSVSAMWNNFITQYAPQITKVMTGLIWLLKSLIAGLAKIAEGIEWIFGGKKEVVPETARASIKATTSDLGNMTTGLGDATKATNELKRDLMGFDEINKVSDSSSGGVASIGGISDNIASIGNLNDAIDDLYANMELDDTKVENPFWEVLDECCNPQHYSSLGNMMSGVVEYIKSKYKGFKPFLNDVFGTDGIEQRWGNVKGIFTKAWASIKTAFPGASKWFESTFSTDGIKQQWRTSLVKGWFDNAWKAIKSVFGTTKKWFGDTFTFESIKQQWKTSIVKGWFDNAWKSIKLAFTTTKKWFGDTFGGAWTAVKNVWAQSTMKKHFDSIWEKIKAPFAKVGNWFKETFENPIDKILDKLGLLKEKTSNVTASDYQHWLDITGQGSNVSKYFPQTSTVKVPNSSSITRSTTNTPVNVTLQVDKTKLGKVTIDSVQSLSRQSGTPVSFAY